jgi:hypothetical protein
MQAPAIGISRSSHSSGCGLLAQFSNCCGLTAATIAIANNPDAELRATEADVGLGPVGSSAAGYGPNAYDYANNVVFRTRVNEFAATGAQRLSTRADADFWDRVVSGIRQTFARTSPSRLLKVVFPDASYMWLEYSVQTPTEFKIKAIHDSEYREIMTSRTIARYVGIFTFAKGGERSLQNRVENARQLGVRVRNSASGGAVSCVSETKEAGANKIVCVRF